MTTPSAVYIIMLHVRGIAQPFGMRFQDEEKAQGLYAGTVAAGPATEVSIEDEYGQRVTVLRSDLAAIQYFGVVRDLETQGDLQILQARSNAKLQQRASTDVALTSHQMVNRTQGGLVRPQ